MMVGMDFFHKDVLSISYNFKKNKMSFLSDNVSNNIYLQFIAWISADICAYYHYMLCILYAVINNISNIFSDFTRASYLLSIT